MMRRSSIGMVLIVSVVFLLFNPETLPLLYSGPMASASSVRSNTLSSQAAASQMTRVKLPSGKQQASMEIMPLVAPLFLEDPQFTSTLVLLNATTLPAPADVMLRDVDGKVITDQQVTVPPSNRLDVPIGIMLQFVGSAKTTGSVLVKPEKKDIAAALSITYRRQTTPSYIDEELAMPMPSSSPTLRTVVNGSKGSPIVAIASLAPTVQHVTMACLPEKGKRFTKTIEVAPGATAITRSCSTNGPAAGDFESVALADDSSSGGAFGIELTSDGPQGGFAAFGLAPRRNHDEEYFTSAAFADPMMAMSSTTVFSGVPVGQASLLPAADYTPVLALANFGSQARHVTVALATTSNGDPTSHVVASADVAAGQSKFVKIQDVSGNAQMQNSFIVKSDGPPGQLLAKLVATSDGPVHEVELLAKDANNGHNGGAHPWSIANGSEATLLLFNSSTADRSFHVSIVYGTGKSWQTSYTLKSMETRAINIGELIKTQLKDSHGNVLPTTLMQGLVLWNTKVNGGQGRMLLSNVSTAMARSFSCSIFQYICPVDVNFEGPQTVTADTGFSYTAFYEGCTDYYDDIWYPEMCSQNLSSGDIVQYLSYYYNNTNSSVLSLEDGYEDDENNGISDWAAIAGGQGSIQVTVQDDMGCSESGGASVWVNDTTPNITGLSPSPWSAGSSFTLHIYGYGFGTNPSVQINDSNGAISYSRGGASDTEIDVNVSIAASDPAENATIIVTSTGYYGQGFVCQNCGSNPTSPSVSVSINPVPAPVPQILFHGRNVAGAPAQSVVIGQQIALTTSIPEPAGLTVVSQLWSVEGSPIAGYNASNSSGQVVQLLSFTNPSLTLYWVSSGTFHATYQYCNNNNQCNSATATFTATAPNITSVSSFVDPVRLNPQKQIEDGDFADALYGIRFTEQVTDPQGAGSNATYQWVQLPTQVTFTLQCNSNVTGTKACKTSGTYVCVPKQALPALDTIYPYETGETVNDSPRTETLGTEEEHEQAETFNAKMYLMWDPALNADLSNCTPAHISNNSAVASTCTGSIPVPLGSTAWGWSGDASQSGSSWVLGSHNPTAAGNGPAFQTSSSFPQWTGAVVGALLSDSTQTTCTKQ
jgi:hypothetical protein